ncbi:aldo/keto reductase [Brevibacillus fulvus]|uniref:Aryl-alcohol dehydrogenase-like predicted oxidoreductase n=1 Tax=Brevibacillus fulvus TaxID=1125967 RepID=A0A938Y0K1_9BACL|nr:aldo/keto reductase [Brevibacillus fulvus]MBM7590249.1 aryl-alcohol dehydrogenase-like predicted oxidoreductase [Brevibacillus fulvus]
MKYLTIPGVDKPLSRLILGTSGLSRDKQTAFALLDAFVELGGNTLDTAHLYNQGKSEQMIGDWLQARRNREAIVIMDKGGHHFVSEDGRHDPSSSRVNPKDITQDLLESLERLQVNYIDLYVLHRDDLAVPVDLLMDMLEEHIRAGRVKRAGVSNWSCERIEAANRYADQKGYHRLVVNSPSFSLARNNEPRWPGTVYLDQEYKRWHQRTQMPVLSWASQASGFFTGRFTPGNKPNPDIARVYYNDDNWERYRRASAAAERLGAFYTANHVALAYVLNQPFPTCAIIGPQTVEELRDCFLAMNLDISAEELQWINLESESWRAP